MGQKLAVSPRVPRGRLSASPDVPTKGGAPRRKREGTTKDVKH